MLPSSTPAQSEDPRKSSLADFARRYWLPIFAFLVLCVACTDARHNVRDKLAVFLSGRGNLIFIVSVVLFLIAVAWRRRAFWPIRWGLEFGVLCMLMVNILRYATHLPRPPHIKHGMIVVGDKFSAGFPSSHTAFAFGFAWLILEIEPRFAPLWFAAAVAIGWSRIELFAHYPYQVLCGAFLGSLLAYGITHAPHGVLASLREFFAARRNAATKPSAL